MIVIKRKDGGYSWMWVQNGADPEREVQKWRSIHDAEYAGHEQVDELSTPGDWDFIEAWEPDRGTVRVNEAKARAFAHRVRRELRQQELAPLDAVIAAQIPGTDAVAVEAQREAIRQKNAALQDAIDAAQSIEALRVIMINARRETK